MYHKLDDWGFGIVETAGGVLSPAPSGTPQADVYRSLRLPVVLVGDHKLGGIGSTISAAESLTTRGFDIDAVVCFDDQGKYQNAEYLTKYFKKLGIPVYSVPWLPKDIDSKDVLEEQALMKKYYTQVSSAKGMQKVLERILDQHSKRVQNMDSMAERTQQTIWHPFTQHKHVEKAEDILVFDSAHGDYFQVKRTSKSEPSGKLDDSLNMLYPAYDGSASWWTQGEMSIKLIKIRTDKLYRIGPRQSPVGSAGCLCSRPLWSHHVCRSDARTRAQAC